MTRFVALASVLTVGTLSLAAAYQQQPAGQSAARDIEVEKLKDNLWVLKGGGGNTAVFVTSNGVVVVDTKNPGWGQPILDKIKTLTDKPVTTIINTHTHGDHVSGNVEFPATVDVIVQKNTKKNMEAMAPVTGNPPPAKPTNIFKEHNGQGLPTRTFTDKMTIGKGDDRVDLMYFGRGHTNGDAWILFTALRVMHAGDIFAGKRVPLLDANNGGSGIEIPTTLTKAADGAEKSVDSIITGHSTQMTIADLREYAAFNQDFLTAVQAAKKAGKSAADFAKSWTIPTKYTGYDAPSADRVKANAETIMKEVK
jgi:cyclase